MKRCGISFLIGKKITPELNNIVVVNYMLAITINNDETIKNEMKKAYYLLFYKVYRFWKAISDDGWSDWKALVTIVGAQALLIIEFYVWCDVVFKDRNIEFPHPYLIIIPFSIILALFNYYLLLHNCRWKQHEEEFQNYSNPKSKLVGWLVFLFLVGILGSLIFSFYRMSLIDWSRYNRD